MGGWFAVREWRYGAPPADGDNDEQTPTARNTRSFGFFSPSLVTISIISVTPVNTTAWFRSLSCWIARSANGSIRSGHRWIIRRAHSAAYE